MIRRVTREAIGTELWLQLALSGSDVTESADGDNLPVELVERIK